MNEALGLGWSTKRMLREMEAGTVTSVALVDAAIARAERATAHLNAFVDTRFEDARREAALADQQRASGTVTLGRLCGVPCSIKEAFGVEGMSWTTGLVGRKGTRATEDAVAVARLRSEGAVVLGVSNTSELCMWMESENRLYGRTHNAYDRRWTAGGSSGGEGALVGHGVVPFGLGSDIGGSIRMPAFFNGIFGHKPTPGWVPNTGQFPNASAGAEALLASGPMCAHAEDLPLLLEILAGRTEGELETQVADVDLEGLRVIDGRFPWSWGRDPSLRRRQEEALSVLASRGAVVEPFSLPSRASAAQLWSSALGGAEGPGRFLKLMGYDHRSQLLPHLPAALVGRGAHTLPAVLLGLVEDITMWLPDGTAAARQALDVLRTELIAQMSGGVMLCSPHPRPAPDHASPQLRPIDWADTALFNALELPVTQVPLGLGEDGRPLGVQVVASPGQDAVALAVAQCLASECGGWVLPPILNRDQYSSS